jgi:Icc-related predicted phosphoesterase
MEEPRRKVCVGAAAALALAVFGAEAVGASRPDPIASAGRADPQCAAPLKPSAPKQVKVGQRTAMLAGPKLTFRDTNPNRRLTLGVLGPINEDSGRNLLALRKYLRFFSDEKVDAIVVTGDVGEVSEGITRVLAVLGGSKLPVLVVIGNRECRAEFNVGVAAAQREFSNIVNMNQVRAVEFPQATLISLPGYHDPNYINCASGCRYYKSTVDEVIQLAKASGAPVMLISHGPPHGEGSQALDYAISGGNVGDPEVTRAIREGNIAFGAFSNIKEAGARATDLPGTTLIPPSTPSKTLFLNPGPADSMRWEMNDGHRSYGMAAVFTIEAGLGSWKGFRAKQLTTEEKAQAAALDPPPRSEPRARTQPAQ